MDKSGRKWLDVVASIEQRHPKIQPAIKEIDLMIPPAEELDLKDWLSREYILSSVTNLKHFDVLQLLRQKGYLNPKISRLDKLRFLVGLSSHAEMETFQRCSSDFVLFNV